MLYNTDIYILLGGVLISLYFYYSVLSKTTKKKFLSKIQINTSLISFFVFIFFIVSLFYFIITYPNEKNTNINQGETLVSKVFTGLTSDIKIYVRPERGTCEVDVLYGKERYGSRISQCRWVSKSDDAKTNSFVNESLGSYYEVRITPSLTNNVSIGITTSNNGGAYNTPYNAIIAPLNSSHSRTEEIVVSGSSYVDGQKSQIFDFESGNAKNIEIFASCSNGTSPKLNLFGSDINEANKFVRITEIIFSDGGFTSLNSKYYIDEVALTHHRYFYVQINGDSASDLYVKLTRRNY